MSGATETEHARFKSKTGVCLVCGAETIRAVKSLRFRYNASPEVIELLQTFQQTCNDAIRIALAENVKSRFDLITKAYGRLKEYGLHTHYLLNACEVAYVSYKNKTRKSVPDVKKPFLKLDNQSYRLDYLLLRIPTAPRKFVYITLKGSNYHLSYLADKSLKRGSITITADHVVISFSKETAIAKPLGRMGIDVNERNVTWSDTSGKTVKVDTSEIAEIKERYKAIRAKIARRTHKDRRIQQPLLAKYGRREHNRTVQALHKITKAVVEHATTNLFAINLEKLKGIRKLYRKGNGQGNSYRGRMNSWCFNEHHRQTEYKADWKGVQINYVKPRGTSRNCPDCGSRVVVLKDRKLYCPQCDKIWDRDDLASKNIMAIDKVPVARPSVCSGEGEPKEETSKEGNPPSIRMEVESHHGVLDRTI